MKFQKKNNALFFRSLRSQNINAVIVFAASLMAGVPPEVCESTINEVYCSVKRSLSHLMH